MQLPSELEFGSFLTYTPRPGTELGKKSKSLMYDLKNNRLVGQPPVSITQLVAKRLVENLDQLPFKNFLTGSAIAIPVPKSSLARTGSLWVPAELAEAMKSAGLVADVMACLQRQTPVPKAATSKPSDRATARQHYDSLGVTATLMRPTEILLLDDVVTRGATLMGAAWRIQEAFPGVPIRAFAAMRTISDESRFEAITAPCQGWIRLWGDQSQREP